jgi:hypothetical protein
MSGSEGGGEETTGRKAGIGASPPTLRGVEQNRVLAEARSSSIAGTSAIRRLAAADASLR